jgi:hypothetical protein
VIRAHREFARALAALSALLGAAAMAAAADLDPGPAVSERQVEPAPRPWTVSFMPYAWLTGLNGHTTVKGRTTDIDADPIEVLEHLGGFDAGSTFSWNVLGAFSWQFATHAGVSYSGVLG